MRTYAIYDSNLDLKLPKSLYLPNNMGIYFMATGGAASSVIYLGTDNVLRIAAPSGYDIALNGRVPALRATPPNAPGGATYYRAYCSLSKENYSSSTEDKYWWSVDSTGNMWFGEQTNGSSTVGWHKALYAQMDYVGYKGSWISGRTNALLRQSGDPTSSWAPVLSMKSQNGSFEIGTIYDSMAVSYSSDTNFNAGTNSTNVIYFNNNNSITANLNGKATSAGYLTDRNNGTATYLNYGAPSIASASYLAAWNGYELRAMTPTNLRNTISANALNRTVITLWSGSVQSGTFSVSNMSRYRMLAILPGSSSGAYATWIIIPCTSDSSALRGIGAYNTSNIEIYTTSGTRSASSITMTEVGRTTFYNNQYPKYSRLYFRQIVGIY